MAKTIEAACKLRYQKVLDAHVHAGSVRIMPAGGSFSNVRVGVFAPNYKVSTVS
jgi:hypothetical protein